MAETSNTQQAAFAAWKEHCSNTRDDTDLVVQNFLHEIHPDYHITRTAPSCCDLHGFANAGHATMTPDRDAGYDATRMYRAPGPRLDKKAGRLVDEVKFGRFLYSWDENDFIVYEVSYTDSYMRSVKLLFILSLASENVKDGHHEVSDRLLLASGRWAKELHNEMYVFDNQSWRKDRDLYEAVQGATWDDVILDTTMKENLLHDVLVFFDSQELYKSMKVPWKRGVIFHGVPGNGKTISIKALINSLAAREDPVPSLYVKSLDGCNGPKWSIQSIFRHARSMAPCLLIFEDLDSLVGPKTRSYFLNEVDGLESNDGILMVGSTNHLSRLDAAITKRPSRFDRKYYFKVPDETQRTAYCRFWGQKFKDAPDVEFTEDICPIIAKLTEGFSFAYLKELFIASLLTLARGGRTESDEHDGEPEEGVVGSDSSSNSDGVVVDAPTTRAEDQGESQSAGQKAKVCKCGEVLKEGDSGKTVEAERPKPKKPMPTVEIPESLRDNKLLKIVQLEAKTLWDQMDNSQDEDEAKKRAAGESGGWRIARALRRLEEAADDE